jgi:hypothetical protein
MANRSEHARAQMKWFRGAARDGGVVGEVDGGLPMRAFKTRYSRVGTAAIAAWRSCAFDNLAGAHAIAQMC